MLKAIAKRFANSNQVIGNTVFSFDKDGLTQIIEAGYARYDFEALLTMNGVYAVSDNAVEAEIEEKEELDESKEAEVQDKSPEPVENEHSGDSDSDKHSEEAEENEESEK